jgi:hypothetical protein
VPYSHLSKHYNDTSSLASLVFGGGGNSRLQLLRVSIERQSPIITSVLCCPHVLHRNCILKHITEGNIQGRIAATGRRGRRGQQLLDDIKEKKVCWKVKEEALDRTLLSSRFGRSYGPVLRQTAE